MMRLLVISDTHGQHGRIDRVVRQAGPHDFIIHAGDHALDILESEHAAKAITVCGNCDGPNDAQVEQVFELLDIKFFVTHGHTLHVKTTPLSLMYRAAEHQAHITIYGHTHTPVLFNEENRIFMNPGSLSYPRGYTECTYAIIEIENREARFSYYTLDGQRIPSFDLTYSL